MGDRPAGMEGWMPIDEPHRQRFKSGVRAAISWLHRRAAYEMNDPHAKAILNSAAFSLGVDLSHNRVKPLPAAPRGESE